MILEEIAEYTAKRYEEVQNLKPLEEIKREALLMNTDTGFPFEKIGRAHV